MRKILMLSPYFFPEQVASTHLTRDINESFFNNDYTIENYVPTPTRGVSNEERKKYKKLKKEICENNHLVVYRFSMFKEGKNLLQRAIRYLLVNIVQYKKGTHAKEVDVIYSGSTPPTQGFLCAKVKRKLSKKYGYKVPFVYNLQDIFPDSLVNAKMTKKGSLIWKIGRKIEDYTYRNADRIITISEDFKANIMNKGVPAEKIVVVPNWINTDNVYPVERESNELFSSLGLDPSLFYVCYSGNIGHSQNMELLLDVASSIRNDLPDVRFVLIGEGAAKQEVKVMIEQKSLTNVLMFPFQDYSQIAQVFSLGDVGLIISKPKIGGSSVPSKTWSIMAAERPVLASFDNNSELAKLIKEIGCGIVADAGNKEELIRGIKSLYEDKEMRDTMGKKGSVYVNTCLNKDKCCQTYVDVLDDAIDRK